MEELLNNISAEELFEWQIFYDIHPFGLDWEDFKDARRETVLLNLWRGDDKETNIKDFLVDEEREIQEEIDTNDIAHQRFLQLEMLKAKILLGGEK